MIDYSVCKLQNPMSEEEDVKYYARLQVSEVMDMEAFAEHVEAHASKFTCEEINAVLGTAVRCLRELLLQGCKIQLGSLGEYSMTVSSKGTRKAEDFTPQNIKQLRVRWTPGKKFRYMLDDAKFNMVASRAAQKAVLKAEKAGQDNVSLAAAKARN